MDAKRLLNMWLSDDMVSNEEFNEELSVAFAKVDGHEVSVYWNEEQGLSSFGLIWIDGEFFNIETG